MNIFSMPDINFGSYIHGGGISLYQNQGLKTLQEDLLAQGMKFTRKRRQEFINLEETPTTEIQVKMKKILREITGVVASEVLRITGRQPSMDNELSAIWVESGTHPMNLIVHRDGEETEVVRATFSVSPTRFLPSDVSIPLDGNQWSIRHYPMGPELLRGMENMTVSSEPGGIGLMTGTTYHRGPRPDEVFGDFSKIYGNSGLKEGQIPRIFGSIWGRIPK